MTPYHLSAEYQIHMAGHTKSSLTESPTGPGKGNYPRKGRQLRPDKGFRPSFEVPSKSPEDVTIGDLAKCGETVDKLAMACYGRGIRPADWLGGSNASILADAAYMIVELRQRVSAMARRLETARKSNDALRVLAYGEDETGDGDARV
jgi:hypothetical protein